MTHPLNGARDSHSQARTPSGAKKMSYARAPAHGMHDPDTACEHAAPLTRATATGNRDLAHRSSGGHQLTEPEATETPVRL